METRVALVTGGARGIGLAISETLARSGFAIAVMGTRTEADVGSALARIATAGRGRLPIYVQGDLSLEASRGECVERVLAELGRIDVLVNNAGVAPKVRTDLLATTEESMDHVLGTNLKGTFFLTQRVAKVMVAAVGRQLALGGEAPGHDHDHAGPVIINISSLSAYASSVQRGEYCISKAGVSMITALFADRLAEYGINVYEVRPGIVDTDMTSGVHDKYTALIEGGLTPIRRWGQPEDVAEAVAVIAEGRLRFSTGEVINVDGGFHMRRL
jgi:3-oxoacyl-[acyl-carrier protein] reductase